MRKFLVAIITLASVALSAPVLAATNIVVDQNQLLLGPGGTAANQIGVFRTRPGSPTPSFNSRYVQTFTAGSNGVLDGIEFQLFRSPLINNDAIRFTLFDGDYLAGSRTVTGSFDLSLNTIATSQQVAAGLNLAYFNTRPLGYSIREGQRFSVTFEVIPSAQFASVSALTGIPTGGPAEQQPDGSFRLPVRVSGYTGGEFFALLPDGSATAFSSNDIGFRSFVDVAGGVPEPATWAMFIAGFGGIGVVARRRPHRTKSISC